jgi:hypothetical protein
VNCSARGDAPPTQNRGARPRARRHHGALQADGAALEHDRLRLRPQGPQRGDEFLGLLVLLVVVHRDAEPLEVSLDPAGHHVEVEPPATDLIECGGHLREEPRGDESGRSATRNRIRRVTAASAVTVVHVSASGAVSSNSPFAKRVGISSE